MAELDVDGPRPEQDGSGPEQDGPGPELDGPGPELDGPHPEQVSPGPAQVDFHPGHAARSVKRLTDPRALRALAHPIRLSLLGMLRTEGPLTATRAGELLGESSASCSFHLRQLAKYGLVEEAGGGQGRQRPWRATALFTDVPEITDSPELAAASGLFRSIVAERYFEQTMRWLEARPDEPAEWQQAAHFGDMLLYLSAGELAELGRQVQALIDPYVDRFVQPDLRPRDARLVSYLQLAFPVVNQGPSGDGAGRAGAAP